MSNTLQGNAVHWSPCEWPPRISPRMTILYVSVTLTCTSCNPQTHKQIHDDTVLERSHQELGLQPFWVPWFKSFFIMLRVHLVFSNFFQFFLFYRLFLWTFWLSWSVLERSNTNTSTNSTSGINSSNNNNCPPSVYGIFLLFRSWIDNFPVPVVKLLGAQVCRILTTDQCADDFVLTDKWQSVWLAVLLDCIFNAHIAGSSVNLALGKQAGSRFTFIRVHQWCIRIFAPKGWIRALSHSRLSCYH